MTVLATLDDLTEYTGAPAPANASQLLRMASLVVRNATRQAIYEADRDTGLPTAPLVRDAMRDATCAMAATYAALGVDPTTGAAGLTQAVSSKSLGSASVTYVTSDLSREALRTALANGRTLTAEAFLTLRQAQLLSPGVVSDHYSTPARIL